MIDCLDLLFRPGDVIELRALGKMKNAVQSGYFKDFAKLAEVIKVLDTTGEHKGIYLVLNKINPALYARSPDRLSTPREAIATTSDADIQARRWLPVDFDAIRPAEISSSEEEHQAALQRSKEVREALGAIGWPEPVRSDSGNGAHLVFAINLPNDEKSTELIELVLKALDALFSDNNVKIDTKNYNASRIWKAYGTMTRKGANVPDRPWRRSQILEVPGELRPVPEELLASMAWEFKQKEEAERSQAPVQAGAIDLEQWLSSHGIDVVKRKSAHGGGTMYVLEKCPWDSSHIDRSAWAVQFPSGAIAAGCHHNSCSGKGWRDLRRLYEPDQPSRKESVPLTPPKPGRKALTQLQLADVADIEFNNDGSTKSVRFNPSRAADAVCQYLTVLSTPDKKIWVYEAGYYRPDGDVVIDQVLDSVAGNAYSISASKEVLKKIYLRTLVPFEDLDRNPYLLCVQNGVVDLLTGTFSEHSPEYRITMPCPIRYDPAARPELFVAFLEDSCSNDDDRLTLLDWLVACACLIEFEYLLFLLGHGGNGKHVYEAVLMALFGSESTEAISLEELTSSKYAMGFLRRARMCIATETNPTRATTELIKKISGNDWLSSDVKNKDRVRFKAFTQLLFDSNSMPIFEDCSFGFQRRFTRINMPYLFCDSPDPQDPMEKQKDGHLIEKLTSPEELSGILNLIIRRAKDIARDRRIHRRENDYREYEQQSHSVNDFIEKFIEFHPEWRENESYQESSDYLYSKFEEYCKYTVGAKVSRKTFSRLIGKENGETSRPIWIPIQQMSVRGFRGLLFEEKPFEDFLETCRRELSLIPDDSYDFLTKEEKNKRSMQRDNLTIPDGPTIYRQILYELNLDRPRELVKDRSQVKSSGIEDKQQQQADFSAQGRFEPSDENRSLEDHYDIVSTNRKDEDVDWELCGRCDRPVPPALARQHHGETYCPDCIKQALAEDDSD